MGNHYDPNEGVACAATERGTRAKAYIEKMHTYSLGSQLQQIERMLREVEKHVLGGEAIDTLRSAAKQLRSFTT